MRQLWHDDNIGCFAVENKAIELRPTRGQECPQLSDQKIPREDLQKIEGLNFPLAFWIYQNHASNFFSTKKTMHPIFSGKNMKKFLYITNLSLNYPPLLPACFLVEVKNGQSKFTPTSSTWLLLWCFLPTKFDDEIIRAHSQLSTQKFCTNAGGKSRDC